MKMKIAFAVALGALFVTAPSATPKGRTPASVPVTVGCTENFDGPTDTGTDTCIVSFTGMDPGTTYKITISDSCGGDAIGTARSGSTTYTFTLDVNDCDAGLVISVTSGSGRRTTTVPISPTGDTGAI